VKDLVAAAECVDEVDPHPEQLGHILGGREAISSHPVSRSPERFARRVPTLTEWGSPLNFAPFKIPLLPLLHGCRGSAHHQGSSFTGSFIACSSY
jgi:hypothetical protein